MFVFNPIAPLLLFGLFVCSNTQAVEEEIDTSCLEFNNGQIYKGPCKSRVKRYLVPLPEPFGEGGYGGGYGHGGGYGGGDYGGGVKQEFDNIYKPKQRYPIRKPKYPTYPGGGGYGHGGGSGYPKPGGHGYPRPGGGKYPRPGGHVKPGIGGYPQPGGHVKPGIGGYPDELKVVEEKLVPCQSKPEGFPGLCRTPSYCFHQFDDIKQYIANQCQRENGLTGICCPIKDTRPPNLPPLPIHIPRIQKLTAKVPKISLRDINAAAVESRKVVKQQLELENILVQKGFFQRRQSMESFHQAFFGPPDPVNRKLAKDGLIALETTIELAKRFNLKPHQARDGLQAFTLFKSTVAEHCIPIPKCNPKSKYRTADGHCNNLNYPLWGRSLTPFIRLAPPAYFDGLNEPRKSVTGKDLPLARVVSTNLAMDYDIPDRKFTLMVMQWGQFIDHDLTLTASTRVDSDNGEGLHCCHEEVSRSPQFQHPACRPIIIPQDDPFYRRHNHFCNNFVRNAPSPRHGCTLGPREQTNQLTNYIDGSMVYGSTEERADFLREKRGGLLRFSIVNNVEYLPFDTDNRSDECAIPRERRLQCFVGGDVRVNEQTGLTILHMLLLREHNRIAKILGKYNPQWDDEILYQETRRIVAAQIQHITLNEWSPLILGRKVMKDFGLLLAPSGYSYDYDPKLNGGIINAFATAAYRFHTLIQGMLKLMTNEGQITQILQLRNLFNNPQTVYQEGNYDRYLNALTGQPTQTFDQFFSEELTNHLFQEHNETFGMDLISLNIQRGRDHGLPGYNAYRKVCGLPPIQNFEELEIWMRQGSAKIFASLYATPDDIDLFVAGNHEKPLPGAVVGPTFACILAEQSRRNKLADRFWYELGNQKHSFTEAQLNEIRKVSIASMVCANSDKIDRMQPLGFIQASEWNPKLPCEKITQPNYILWKNEPIY